MILNLSTHIAARSVTFSWENPDDVTFIHAHVYRDDVLVGEAIIDETFVDSGLHPDQTYLYRITSVDDEANETEGVTLEVVTKKPARSNFKIMDSYELSTTEPNPGHTLFLLGTAKDGPINSPRLIKSLNQAIRLFGPKEEGDLVQAYEHAAYGSDQISIYLMRVSGSYATGTLQGQIDGVEQDVLNIRAVHGGEDYNFIRTYVGEIERDGVDLPALFIEFNETNAVGWAYIFEDYENLKELTDEINRDTQLKENYIFMSTPYPQASLDCLIGFNADTTRSLEDGTDGLDITKNDLFFHLIDSYRILEGHYIDIICPVSARFDDAQVNQSYNKDGSNYDDMFYAAEGDFLNLVDTLNGNKPLSFHEQLITFCLNQNQVGIVTHGVMGMREINTTHMNKTHAYVSNLANETMFKDRSGLMQFVNGSWKDVGYYISLVAGDLIYHQNETDEHYANWAPLYAGILAGSRATDQLTNRALPEEVALRFTFDEYDTRVLTFLGVTIYRESPKKGPAIGSAITGALNQSPFHLTPNVRMIQQSIHRINEVADEFIGEAYAPALVRRKLNEKLDRALSLLMQEGTIVDYRYDIAFDARGQRGTINLELLTRYSIKYISTSANVIFANEGVS